MCMDTFPRLVQKLIFLIHIVIHSTSLILCIIGIIHVHTFPLFEQKPTCSILYHNHSKIPDSWFHLTIIFLLNPCQKRHISCPIFPDIKILHTRLVALVKKRGKSTKERLSLIDQTKKINTYSFDYFEAHIFRCHIKKYSR